MKKKERQLNIKTTELQIEQLNKAAQIIEIPAAQLVREAIKEKLFRLGETSPQIKNLLQETTLN